MILIVGASSKLGSRVAERLLAQGREVKAFSRDPAGRLATLAQLGATLVQGDVRDPASLGRAVTGVDTVLASAHAIAPPQRGNTIIDVDRDGNQALIAAAAKAGVKHFVLASIWTPLESPPSAFLQAKRQAEDALRTSGLPSTIVRPTAFMETHVLDMVCEPLCATGKIQVFGKGTTPLNFVSVDDVAEVVAGVITAGPDGGCRTVNMGGPETLTRLQMIELAEKVLGIAARKSQIPVPVMKVMKTATRFVNPGLSYLIDFSLAESTRPDAFAWTPAKADVVGPTRLETVIEHWAEEHRSP